MLVRIVRRHCRPGGRESALVGAWTVQEAGPYIVERTAVEP